MKIRFLFTIFNAIYIVNLIKFNACNVAIDEQSEEQVIDSNGDELSSKLKSSCETLPSKIHVTKEEHDQVGNAVRVCEGFILVNKCEGTCISQLRPSVTTPTGFLKVLKECVCCRESYMKQRAVHLTECYDPDGKKLNGKLSSMSITMTEPEQCRCHKCG